MEKYSYLEIEKLSESKTKRYKIIILAILFLFMAFNGVTTSLPDDYSQIKYISDMMLGPVLVGVAMGWCSTDSQTKGLALGFGWFFGIFLLAPLAVPAYFYKTYGAKTGTKKTLMAYAIFFIAIFIDVFFEALIKVAINK
jgi:hypothetical protein